MKKLLATFLLLAVCASSAFAWGHKKPKTSHHKYDYRYKAPKSFKTHIHTQKQKHNPA
jgi:hypothetical protein